MMNRRAALKSLAALAGVSLAGAAFTSSPTPTTYGYLTPAICEHRGLDNLKARVFLNGVDVTHLRVQAADDRRGYIELFNRDPRGNYFSDGKGGLARERRYGHVEVRFS